MFEGDIRFREISIVFGSLDLGHVTRIEKHCEIWLVFQARKVRFLAMKRALSTTALFILHILGGNRRSTS